MNVIVSNKQRDILSELNINVIKSIEGLYSIEEFISIFQNMYFEKMILDVTAIRDYNNTENFEKITNALPSEKIILLLPVEKETTSSAYLSALISMGIYNFTTNLDGVKYLLKNPNTYKDAEHIFQFGDLSSNVEKNVTTSGVKIFGIRNLTNHAGSTTLIYMLKKELEESYNLTVYGIELNRHEFSVFNDNQMISIRDSEISNTIERLKDADVILIDMNDVKDEDSCENVLYLLEPSIIMLNKLIKNNKNVFQQLKGNRIVLNKCLLDKNDISDLEYEVNTKFFYNLPPLNDRKKNHTIFAEFLSKLGFIHSKEVNKPNDEKIIGLFKK